MPKTKAKYLILDTEATGFFPGRHGLIQVAALALDKDLEIIDEFLIDIKPPDGFEISEEAMEITGFTLDRINLGKSYQEFCERYLQFLQKNFAKDPKLVAIAQFYPFDWSFLQHVFIQTGYAEKIIQDYLGNDFIDTKALVNSLNLWAEMNHKPKPFPSTSLSKPGGLKEKLNVALDYKSHDAMGDVLATRDVLKQIIKVMPNLLRG